jgi:hypothetical protein
LTGEELVSAVDGEGLEAAPPEDETDDPPGNEDTSMLLPPCINDKTRPSNLSMRFCISSGVGSP